MAVKEYRISVKLTDEEVQFVKWLKENRFYESSEEKISFNQTLARMFFLRLEADMELYREEAGL